MNKTGIRTFLLILLCLSVVPAAIANPIVTLDVKFILHITGSITDPLSMPSDVAVDDHKVYVVDGGNHRVVVFDHKGKYLYAFGSEGTGYGQFQGPVGIDAGQDGKIYVADAGNNRIQIFAANGDYLDSFPVKTGETAVRPIDVAASRDGKEIYVTGNSNHRVMIYTAQGDLLRQWGGSGLNPGEFRYPGTITLLQDGRLAVVDILNTRIQVFDPSGRFSIEVGEWGVLQGQLFRPKGVAVDNAGDIYVSDSYMNLVQVYRDTGVFKHVLKPTGIRDSLETPVGMTIGDDNRLYVTEMVKNRVSVFALGD